MVIQVSDLSTALIIGGSSGIGAATAEVFLSHGWRVLIIGKTRDHVDRTLSALSDYSTMIKGITCDITSDHELKIAVKEVLSWGSPKVVVLSAGEGRFGPLDTITLEDYHQVFDTEVQGKFFLLKYLSNTLLRNEATIIVIGSTLSFEGIPDASLYVASKHAVLGLVRALQEEWVHTRVRVIGVYPGDVNTPFFTEGPPHPTKVIEPKDLAHVLYQLTELPESLTVTTIIIQPRVKEW